MKPSEVNKKSGIFHEKLRTAKDPVVEECVNVPGARHDMRLYTYEQYGRRKTSLVCIWCGGVACGEPTQLDPCLEIYHHTTEHVSARGERWPVGGSRPEPVEA